MTDARDEATRLVEQWLEIDIWPETRAAAQRLLHDGMYLEILRNLNPADRVSMVAGDIRADYGVGYKRVNELVVAQTAQAMYYYCLRVIGEIELKIHGVGIGYDSSPHAKDFAKITAVVFLSQGIRVYLVSEPVPVSYVQYINKYYMCGCGFMSTASCTPRLESRYIIYGIGHGSPLSAPHDANMYETIVQDNKHVFEPWPVLQCIEKTLSEALESNLLVIVDRAHEVLEAYQSKLQMLKYFARDYTDRTRATFRIGCFSWGIHDQSIVAHMLSTVFKFSPEAIKARFAFINDAHPKSPLSESRELELCREVEKINAESPKDIVPIKVILSIDFNAEEIFVAEIVDSKAQNTADRWKLYHKRDTELIVTWWCMENFHQNPVTRSLLKEHGFEPESGHQFYVSGFLVPKGELKTIVGHYSDTVVYENKLGEYKWLGSLSSSSKESGAVCTLYQGIDEFAGQLIIDRDGTMLFGIMVELLIDIYEFYGAGIAIRHSNTQRPRVATFRDFLASYMPQYNSRAI